MAVTLTSARCAVSLAAGLALAGAFLAACSAIDPTPPHPHLEQALTASDAGDAADAGDTSDAAEEP